MLVYAPALQDGISGSMAVRDVPTTVVTGALGVGKTTAVLELFSRRPVNERWAVLVNEFGEVGVDGAAMAGSGIEVREVAGGCICCAAGMELRVALVELLRRAEPDRLLIEPTGLARPAAVLDQLRSPGIADAVRVRATIGLVDPRQFVDDAVRGADTYSDQLLVSDILVGHKADLCTSAQLQRFREISEALDPPKVIVDTAVQGRLPAEWLDLDPSPARVEGHGGHRLHGSDEAASRGWLFPADAVFDRALLELTIQDLVRPGALLGAGVLRLKGIFRTRRAWLWIDATADTIRSQGTDWRRDSRMDVVVPPTPEPDWDIVEAALKQALISPG